MKTGKILAAALFLTAPSIAASACEEIHALEYVVEGGDYSIHVNGVYVVGEEGGSGTRPLMPFDFVVSGENQITFALLDDNASAEVAIMKGCVGSFEFVETVDSAKMAGKATETLSFTHSGSVNAAHARASSEGADGLMEAVAKLQAAIEAGDVETALALHGPMIADAASMGMPTERMAGMFGYFFSEGSKTILTDLQIEQAMGGKVFVVTTSDREAPVEVVVDTGNGRDIWRSGAYWGRVDGEWGVLTLFQ